MRLEETAVVNIRSECNSSISKISTPIIVLIILGLITGLITYVVIQHNAHKTLVFNKCITNLTNNTKYDSDFINIACKKLSDSDSPTIMPIFIPR